jgi:alkyl sulfatase BDS1-like metallo-beta-lactamase superfamily hydrolase
MRIDETFACASASAGRMTRSGTALAQTAPVPPKPAKAATKAANRQVQQALRFSDKEDFENAFELRNGVRKGGGLSTASPDTIRVMPPQMLLDYLPVRLNGPNAAGKKIALNLNFTDLKKQYALVVENAVLNYSNKPVEKVDAAITLSKATLDSIQLKEQTIEQAITAGELKVEGRREAFTELLALLDTFPFWFNIVTP